MGFTVTNDFVNGTLADATEVNANFADIEAEIDKLHILAAVGGL